MNKIQIKRIILALLIIAGLIFFDDVLNTPIGDLIPKKVKITEDGKDNLIFQIEEFPGKDKIIKTIEENKELQDSEAYGVMVDKNDGELTLFVYNKEENINNKPTLHTDDKGKAIITFKTDISKKYQKYLFYRFDTEKVKGLKRDNVEVMLDNKAMMRNPLLVRVIETNLDLAYKTTIVSKSATTKETIEKLTSYKEDFKLINAITNQKQNESIPTVDLLIKNTTQKNIGVKSYRIEGNNLRLYLDEFDDADIVGYQDPLVLIEVIPQIGDNFGTENFYLEPVVEIYYKDVKIMDKVLSKDVELISELADIPELKELEKELKVQQYLQEEQETEQENLEDILKMKKQQNPLEKRTN